MNLRDAEQLLTGGRRIVLDWYDGELQTVVADLPGDPWYVFAISVAGSRWRYAAFPVGPEAVRKADAAWGFASSEAAVDFGRQLLEAAPAGIEAYELEVEGGRLTSARRLSSAEVASARPRSMDALLAGKGLEG